MKPGCPADPLDSYLKHLQLPHMPAPGTASPASRPCQGEGWQRVAMQGDIGLTVPTHPCKSCWLCTGWVVWVIVPRPRDRVMESRSQRERARVAESLLRSRGGSTEGCECWLLAQPPRRETEAALAVSQTCHAGLCGNIVISLQMSDDESCCVSNTPPSPHNMGYITCSEDLRAVTEKNALSLREGLDSGNSMSPWNGGLRLGALSQSWSLGQKPGCSHTAFVCPASWSNALGLLDSKPARGKAWALWRSLGANQAPMVLIWDTV